ncbi:MAG: RDD family protein [Acidimicrobiia bacterium]
MRDRQVPLLVLLIAAAAARDGDDTKKDGFLSRISSGVTGAVVDIVDPEKIVEQIDVNALMERVDINELLDRVDVNELMDRVDVDALLDRVDVNHLMDRVDVNQLLDRVDVNHLMDRIDVNHLMDRVDVKALTDRAGIPEIVQESTGALAGSAMDVVRRQIVSLDQILGRFTYRLIGRDPSDRPVAPPALSLKTDDADKDGRGEVTGHYAGPVSRLGAFVLDSIIVWLVFILFGFGVAFVLDFIFHADVNRSWEQTVVGVLLFTSWAFIYFWVGFALAGRTIGMGIVGISVVDRQGTTIAGKNAFIRTLVFPVSLLVPLGFLGIFTSPTRRALHDAAAGTVVVYDWGDRPAEMSAPITKWVNRHTDPGEAAMTNGSTDAPDPTSSAD